MKGKKSKKKGMKSKKSKKGGKKGRLGKSSSCCCAQVTAEELAQINAEIAAEIDDYNLDLDNKDCMNLAQSDVYDYLDLDTLS